MYITLNMFASPSLIFNIIIGQLSKNNTLIGYTEDLIIFSDKISILLSLIVFEVLSFDLNSIFIKC